MSLLEQDTTTKGRVDKNVTELEFNAGNNKEYKMEAIWNSTVYTKESKGHVLEFYYLIAWKGYSKEENT